jgi:hypothetical protein
VNLVDEAQWERTWAPYDEATYQAVFDEVQPDDIVLDIGAGDLRLTRRIARRAQHVYGLEQNLAILPDPTVLPANLSLACTDAREAVFPPVTLGVLLMRHCRHFQLYAQKLLEAGCRRLLTNARWGMNVELIDLLADRPPFSAVSMGWYACICGAAGFLPGPAEQLTPELETIVYEVKECPNCQ